MKNWIEFKLVLLKWQLQDWGIDLAMWAAWHLPKKVVYWAGVRLMAHAANVYSDVEMDAITPTHVLNAWDRHDEERL